MALTKAQQIKGLKKALKNKRTPRAFIPSMKKRLAKLTGTAVLIAVLCGCAARPAVAQTPVIIAPQQQTLATTGTPCTGTAQNFVVNNRNQSLHYATAAGNGTITSFQFVIQGIDTQGNIFQLSDIGQIGGSITGSGYFPTIRVQVTCLPATTGTFALSYSGSSSTAASDTGSFLYSQIDKLIFRGTAATSNTSSAITPTPFGSSSGRILFQFSAPQGGTSPPSLTLNCQGNVTIGFSDTFGYSLSFGTTLQEFTIPTTECPSFQITYSPSNTGSAGTFALEYIFDPAGLAPSLSQSSPCISSTSAVTAPLTAGVNSTVRVAGATGAKMIVCALAGSTGVTGTIQITEGTGSTCGTGSANLSGAMTVNVGIPFVMGAAGPIFSLNTVGDSLCITTAGGASFAGLISYTFNPI